LKRANNIFLSILCFFVIASSSLYAFSKQEYEAKKQKELKRFHYLEQTSRMFHLLRAKNKHDFEYLSLYFNRILITYKSTDKEFGEYLDWLKYKTLYGNRDTFFYPAFYSAFLNTNKVYKTSTLMSLLAVVRLEVDALRCEKYPTFLRNKWRKTITQSLPFGRFIAYDISQKHKSLKLAFQLENYQLGRAKDARLCNNKFVSDSVWLELRKANLNQIYKGIMSE